MYRLTMYIGLMAMASAVVGCGTAAHESASAPLTKAQFIKQADAICAKATKEREAAAAAWLKKLPGGPSEAEARLDDALREVVAPSLKEEAMALEDLGPPEDKASEVSRMLGHLAEAGDLVAKEGSKGLRAHVLPAFENEATTFGLKICSNPY